MSREDQIRRKQVSAEQTIRYQHEFETKLREFLSLAATLTDKELEVALGRLADMLNADTSEHTLIRIKGLILNLYYQLRTSGLKRQSGAARAAQWLKMPSYRGTLGEALITRLAAYQLPANPNEDTSSPISEDTFRPQVKLLAP